jgi:hypothetical protein
VGIAAQIIFQFDDHVADRAAVQQAVQAPSNYSPLTKDR